MKPRIIIKAEPSHWSPNGKWHHPHRCLICWSERILMKLGIVGIEYETYK
jgi:hypothetical protein